VLRGLFRLSWGELSSSPNGDPSAGRPAVRGVRGGRGDHSPIGQRELRVLRALRRLFRLSLDPPCSLFQEAFPFADAACRPRSSREDDEIKIRWAAGLRVLRALRGLVRLRWAHPFHCFRGEPCPDWHAGRGVGGGARRSKKTRAPRPPRSPRTCFCRAHVSREGDHLWIGMRCAVVEAVETQRIGPTPRSPRSPRIITGFRTPHLFFVGLHDGRFEDRF
jgi:hypothetical protein